jgi:hypothetical protein
LRVRIARGRLCASVLVVTQRKMALVRALLGRATMAGVGAPCVVMGELAVGGGGREERKQEGGRREEKKKGRKKKEKEKKWENFLNLEISKKIKDNL